MEAIGTGVVYIIMACALVGAVVSVFKPEHPLGKEFVAGIDAIGPIFLPVAGIMAATPYITAFISKVFGPAFALVGADPAMAATTFIAIDMGGYQLANALAATKESWIMAMLAGYTAGATIVFSIPVGLKMIEKRDQKYMALGIMAGILSVPFGVLLGSVVMSLTDPMVREVISTNGEATYVLALSFVTMARNLVPLAIICALIAIGLKLFPDKMIKGFLIFGRVLEGALKLVLVVVVIEYFTGLFTRIFGDAWGFDPIIADEADIFRALEVSGAIGIMLCGAFPMVWLIKRFLSVPLGKIGGLTGLSADATAGLLAAAANVLALFAMVKDLRAKDKVICISFSVGCAFLFGDHLSFTANFQPTLIVPVMLAKLTAGVVGIFFAFKLAVATAERLEGAGDANGTNGTNGTKDEAGGAAG